MWVAEDIRMALLFGFGKKVKGAGPGAKNPQNKKCAERHARRLKICMQAAEGIKMTCSKKLLGKKSRGPGQGPKIPEISNMC